MYKLYRKKLGKGFDTIIKKEKTIIFETNGTDITCESESPTLEDFSDSYESFVAEATAKYDTLRDLDVFVLDNSIRESTVGQLKGHTVQCKWEIYDEVKKCGFKHTVVASFSHSTRVDDVFVQELVDKGEDLEFLWAFSEITEGAQNGIPDTETIPIGIRKLKEFGLYNVIFEVDLGDAVYDFDKISVDDICSLLKKRIIWCQENLNKKTKIMVNLRDPEDTMAKHSSRVFQVVEYLAKLHADLSIFGIIYEDATGKSLPEECGAWGKFIRKVMDHYNWNGHLLVHVHKQFGYADASALHALLDGCNGIWASVCIEGASMGNASSCVTLMNLIRLGNKKVNQKYNCSYLRKAAINVTRVSTGSDPPEKQPIYGSRALDFIFSMAKDESGFDMAEFFGEETQIRITTMSSPEMIKLKLIQLFGEMDHFTDEISHQMKELILEDLRSGRKEEYMSRVGIALLFDRAGGSLNEQMRDTIDKEKVNAPYAIAILAEIRRRWDEWDTHDKVQGDDMLQYDSFYNGFMAPYFACYRCSDTKKAVKALDMDNDGQIDWNEFSLYLKWALHEYPDSKDADEVLDIAFRKGLIPAMRDELLKNM